MQEANLCADFGVKYAGEFGKSRSVHYEIGNLVRETVIDPSKPNQSSFRLSMLLVILGLCVFFWGFGYKMSLYQPHRSSIHRIPAAKLLSRNEDSNATDGVRLCLSRPANPDHGLTYTFILLVLPLVASILRASWSRQFLSLPKTWDLRFQVVESVFILRPPPAICRL